MIIAGLFDLLFAWLGENLWIKLPIIVVGLLYLGPLLLIKGSVWIARSPKFDRIDLDEFEPLPAEGPSIESWRTQLEQLGFEPLGGGWSDHAVANTHLYLFIFKHPTENIVAALQVIRVAVPGQAPVPQMSYVELQTRAVSGGFLTTLNPPPGVGAESLGPNQYRFIFRDEPSLRRLLAYHRYLLTKVNLGSPLRREGEQDLLSLLSKDWEEGMRRMIKSGQYSLDAKDQRLRLTWLGAIRQCWANMPPGKQISRYLIDRQGLQAIRAMPAPGTGSAS
jgi:hypothetical protein